MENLRLTSGHESLQKNWNRIGESMFTIIRPRHKMFANGVGRWGVLMGISIEKSGSCHNSNGNDWELLWHRDKRGNEPQNAFMGLKGLKER